MEKAKILPFPKSIDDTNVPKSYPPKVNALKIQEFDETAGVPFKEPVGDIQVREIVDYDIGLERKVDIVDPLALYDKESSNIIVVIYDIMTTAIKYLERARLAREDILEFNISLDLFRACFNKLIFIKEPNQNFLDIITAIFVALENKKEDVYNEQELNLLISILNKIKNNIIMDDICFNDCLLKMKNIFNILIKLPNGLELVDE
jgi:hypothetical protein